MFAQEAIRTETVGGNVKRRRLHFGPVRYGSSILCRQTNSELDKRRRRYFIVQNFDGGQGLRRQTQTDLDISLSWGRRKTANPVFQRRDAAIGHCTGCPGDGGANMFRR